MKKFLYIAVLFLVVVSIGTSSYLIVKNKELNKSLSIARNNEKAYESEIDDYKNKTLEFKYTINQFKDSNDSLLTEMNKVRKELKIKDKDLKALQVLVSETSKKDTVFFTDTIFRNPEVNIDTTKKDDWYSVSLHLEYPNIVNTEVKFNNECYVVTSNRKETVKPPKKCFIARWFQKKHTVVEINVIEKNPYSINKQQKFIEIVK